MPEYKCEKCLNETSFETLSHPANRVEKAIMCINCGAIWIETYPIEEKD